MSWSTLSRTVVGLGLCCLGAAACGKRTNPGPFDLKPPADLRMSADLRTVPDLAGSNCTADPDYGALGKRTGNATSQTGGSGELGVFWDTTINSDANPDAISIELY